MTDVRQPVWERSLNQLINAMSAAAALPMIKVSAWGFIQKGLCRKEFCPEGVMSGRGLSREGNVWRGYVQWGLCPVTDQSTANTLCLPQKAAARW